LVWMTFLIIKKWVIHIVIDKTEQHTHCTLCRSKIGLYIH
jgi:hypothetical protein